MRGHLPSCYNAAYPMRRYFVALFYVRKPHKMHSKKRPILSLFSLNTL